jgi:CheY-like chemotaxis protein
MTAPAADSAPRLLLADDDEPFRHGLAGWLTRQGFTVTHVPSGPAALAALRAEEFDALIADINMPGNAQLELIAQIPQLVAGLPVILLTGNPTVATATQAVRLPVTAYLAKPPEFPELLTLLHDAIAGHRRYRALTASRARLADWEVELARLTTRDGPRPPTLNLAGTQDFLRVTLRQVLLQLAEADRCLAATSAAPGELALRQQVDLIGALRHTITVLEQTKQNFKSKPLADLRHQLEDLLATSTPPAPPSQS